MRLDIHMYRAAQTSRKMSVRNRFAATTARLAGLLALSMALLAACGDSGTGPDTRVASVSVSPAARAMIVRDVATLEAIVRNRAGQPLEGREVEWTTSDASVATVSFDGEVEAIGAGRATITATAEGESGTARIDVAPLPPAGVARVVLDVDHVSLRRYGSRQLAAVALDADGEVLAGRTIGWISLSPEVASVDQTGRVTAHAIGDAQIVASVEGRSATAHVGVGPAPVARVVLTAQMTEMDRGETQRLSVRLEDEKGLELTQRAVAWSAEGAALLLSNDGVLTALGEGTAAITATSEERSATVDVRIVAPPAFDLIYDRPTAAGGAEIFLLGLGGPAAPRKLNAGNVSSDPSPSPDGTRYVFAVSQVDFATGRPQNDLYIVNVNGMAIRHLTSMPGIEREPAWSPDGSRIAFAGVGEMGRTDIWVVNVDGTGLVNLTSAMGELSAELAPAWSPDGTRIAFATSHAGIAGPIWTMKADGSDRAALATDLVGASHPAWSPDGARLAVQHFSAATMSSDLAIVPVSGGAATRLPLAGDQMTPAWSPDGALLAYTARDAAGAIQLWTVRPDGTGARTRTTAGGRNASWIVR